MYSQLLRARHLRHASARMQLTKKYVDHTLF